MSLTDWIDAYERREWRTASEGRVRYALIGLGWWTSDVAMPAIESSELCETTVLVSGSAEKAERIAADRGVERGISYEQFHDGAAADAYDAVYVATPNAHHVEYARTAAELGKAVLCEKPMEASVERAERMVEAFDGSDAPLMIAYRMQTDPAVRRARELVASGFLGELVHVYGSNSQPLLRMNADPDQWRLDPDLSGYGTSVMDLGIYPINTARYLLRRDPIAVQARTASDHEAFDDVPDERASFLFALDGGGQMVCTASQRAQTDSHLTLTGTDGRIELHPAFHGDCTLRVTRGDLTVEASHAEFDAVDEMREEFDYFADRVLSGADVYPDGRHGLADMRIIEAVHEAGESGDVVELDP